MQLPTPQNGARGNAISTRAVGCGLPNTSADVSVNPIQRYLQISKINSTSKLAIRFRTASSSRACQGTREDKMALGGCVACHTLQRVPFSRYDSMLLVRSVAFNSICFLPPATGIADLEDALTCYSIEYRLQLVHSPGRRHVRLLSFSAIHLLVTLEISDAKVL